MVADGDCPPPRTFEEVRKSPSDSNGINKLAGGNLASFGVTAKVVNAARVSGDRYEIQPGPGIKVSRITAGR